MWVLTSTIIVVQLSEFTSYHHMPQMPDTEQYNLIFALLGLVLFWSDSSLFSYSSILEWEDLPCPIVSWKYVTSSFDFTKGLELSLFRVSEETLGLNFSAILEQSRIEYCCKWTEYVLHCELGMKLGDQGWSAIVLI